MAERKKKLTKKKSYPGSKDQEDSDFELAAEPKDDDDDVRNSI